MCRAQSLPAILRVDYSWWCGMCLSPRERPKGAFLQFLLSCPLPSSNCSSLMLGMKGSPAHKMRQLQCWAQHEHHKEHGALEARSPAALLARMAAQTGILSMFVLLKWSCMLFGADRLTKKWQFLGKHDSLSAYSHTEKGEVKLYELLSSC